MSVSPSGLRQTRSVVRVPLTRLLGAIYDTPWTWSLWLTMVKQNAGFTEVVPWRVAAGLAKNKGCCSAYSADW
jgi:hypothetical protein